ncbi:probable receptor-like protein kinase At5g20050 [Miscanthus floridulus]|uniref:probable receptor-like protein kinase At5g20050 n=1 Tax=Miscanthus floridulus TaxID=154761 RepID=UPI003459EBA5
MDLYNSVKVWLLIQLVAYNAVAFLYICNSSGRKEKVISGGLLVLVLLGFLLSSSAHINIRTDLIFGANIVAICSYCIWYYWKLYPWIRRWLDAIRRCLDALDAHTETEPREPARQLEAAAVLQLQVQQTPFRIRDMPKEFSSDEIQAMTQDFGNRIGRGASAQVFRGSLDDGTAVAVKRIHMHSGRTEAGEEEFRREVSIIANVHHRSLVRLLGYGLQHGGGLYLVYPFFENGSLDRWIFNRSDEQRRLLTWPKRLCIAVDVARALAYLHKDCHRRILHLDIKPGNILLDGDLRAHVSDFGISLCITRDLTSVINTRGRGTFGYMAPEMLVNAVSDRSDVFSYGMTLLELIGGHRNFDPSSSAAPDPNIARNLRERMAQGEHMELVDVAMAVAVDDEEAVKTVVKVALCCIQHERDMRPSMQNVVDMLEGRVTVNFPPEAHRPSSFVVSLSEPHSIPEHAVIDMHGG